MTGMSSDPRVLWLAECTGDCAPLVGGKATGLGALLREGLQVPAGFAITTAAYREHIQRNGLAADLERLLADCATFEAQQRASDEIRAMFDASRPTPALQESVLATYDRLSALMKGRSNAERSEGDPGGAKRSRESVPVAVRSSATAEDTATASFAGQQDTFLWILGGNEVLRHVTRCWSSLFTPHAIAYRAQMGTPVEDLAMGVVVQQMVPAEAAGVMLTLDPITGDASGIVIEAAYGLGAAVVNGEVDPDRFCVDKSQLAIRSRAIGVKSVAYRFDSSIQGTRREEVPPPLQGKPCVADAEVIQLASLGKHMEQAMGRSQDIEWAIGPGPDGSREVFLLQSRPETVWSQKMQPPSA
jgi:phosphoenolpyruvate synthase/pyruvate phosphate dikinase